MNRRLLPWRRRKGDDELDRLLARGRLGGAVREEILERALASPSRMRAGRAWLVFAPLAALGLVLLLVLVPRRPGFVSKGTEAALLLEIGCVGSGEPRCAENETLLFRVEGASEGGYLGAYAEPQGGGERVWYFPLADGSCPRVAPQAELQTLGRGVKIGPEQPPGRYQVHLVLGTRPLTQGEVMAGRGAAVVSSRTTAPEVIR